MTPLVVGVVVALVSAIGGFRMSQRLLRRLGATPWRWPSWLWAIVCASFLVGFALMAIAFQTTRTPAVLAPPPHSSERVNSPLPEPNAVPKWSRDGSDPAEPGWYQDSFSGHGLRCWDGRNWTEFAAPSREALVADARLDDVMQRAFLVFWGGGFALGWIFVLAEEIFGRGANRPPLAFAVPWLVGVGLAVPFVVWKPVHHLELRDGQLSWRGLLRRGQCPVGDLRRVSSTGAFRGFVRIEVSGRSFYVSDSRALLPFVDVVAAVAPGVEIDPELFSERKLFRRGRWPGRFSTAADRDAMSESARSPEDWRVVEPDEFHRVAAWRSVRTRTIGAILGVALLVASVAVIAVRLNAYLDHSPMMSAPGRATLRLAPGTYVLFERTAAAGSHDCYPLNVCISISSRDVSVSRLDGTGVVRVWNDPSNDGITRDGLHYAGAVKFVAPTRGSYRIEVRTTGRRGEIVVALQPSEEAFALSGWIAAGGIGLLIILVVLVGTATAYRDRRPRRDQDRFDPR